MSAEPEPIGPYDVGEMVDDPVAADLILRSEKKEGRKKRPGPGTTLGHSAPPLDRLPVALAQLRDARADYERQFDDDAAWADEMNAAFAARKDVRDMKEKLAEQARNVVITLLADYSIAVTGADPMWPGPKMPLSVDCVCGERLRYVPDKPEIDIQCKKCHAITHITLSIRPDVV